MRIIFIYSTIILCALFAACTNDKEASMLVSSGDAINIKLSHKEHNSVSRAHVYDQDSALYKEQYGGGNFWVKAYPDNRSTEYINSRVWYFADGKRWWFRKSNEWYDCYWPKNNKLSFFAYMPWVSDSAATTISDYSYTSGPSFSCNLPLNNTAQAMNQDKVREFMYAFTKDRYNEIVPLNFVHPMSAVYFKLKQSHRDLTIHSIGFEKIYNKGTFSYNEETTQENRAAFASGFTCTNCWTPTNDARQTMSIKIEKTIPEDINFDAEIGGPYIVMPQLFSGSNAADTLTLYITYTWDTDVNVTKGIALKRVHSADEEGWQPGKKYTYMLDLGDNLEEILFRVLVEPWKVEEYKDIIDIE